MSSAQKKNAGIVKFVPRGLVPGTRMNAVSLLIGLYASLRDKKEQNQRSSTTRTTAHIRLASQITVAPQRLYDATHLQVAS